MRAEMDRRLAARRQDRARREDSDERRWERFNVQGRDVSLNESLGSMYTSFAQVKASTSTAFGGRTDNVPPAREAFPQEKPPVPREYADYLTVLRAERAKTQRAEALEAEKKRGWAHEAETEAAAG